MITHPYEKNTEKGILKIDNIGKLESGAYFLHLGEKNKMVNFLAL